MLLQSIFKFTKMNHPLILMGQSENFGFTLKPVVFTVTLLKFKFKIKFTKICPPSYDEIQERRLNNETLKNNLKID